MTRRVQDCRPARTRAVADWVEENLEEQRARHAAIMREMNESLAAERARWYEEFLQTIQTLGFNVNGDQRRVIPAAELPRRPERPDRVVW
jgi:hypothetical protein